MNNTFRFLTLPIIALSYLGTAQNSPTIVEGFKPSSVNQSGKEYSQVDSEGWFRVQISAPKSAFQTMGNTLTVGEIAFRLHDGGHSTGPN